MTQEDYDFLTGKSDERFVDWAWRKEQQLRDERREYDDEYDCLMAESDGFDWWDYQDEYDQSLP